MCYVFVYRCVRQLLGTSLLKWGEGGVLVVGSNCIRVAVPPPLSLLFKGLLECNPLKTGT